MKPIIITTLSTSLLVFAIPSVSAQQILRFRPSQSQVNNQIEKITAKTNSDNVSNSHISPLTLVQLGYQGYFDQQGIPSNELFRFGIKNKTVNARKLVESAVNKGRLSPKFLNDQEYLNQVELQLYRYSRF